MPTGPIEAVLEEIIRRVVREELARAAGCVHAPPPDHLRWFTTDEVAARTGISEDTVRDYCVKGKIKASKRAGAWRVRAVDLEAFMEMGDPTEKVPDPHTVAWELVAARREGRKPRW
ncbi:MAG: helix-turn-helix domain-containing protein [Deltaproteobacteria bacterium]|nr:helix-turn-helix domain-containing protein [Deltaproteobacteria bacterium]